MGAQGEVPFDLTQIAKESQQRIKRSLVEGFEYEHLAISKSDRFLRDHVYEQLDFAVAYFDLIDSTKLSVELSPNFLSKLIMVFSQEVSNVIERFHGLLLKFVGDAVIGYFPFSRDLDGVVSCGKAVVYIVEHAINPLLLQMGHDGIRVKVTADYGRHTIVRYGSDSNRSHVDLISVTMNLAAKMQSVTKAGHMVIGSELYNRLGMDQQAIFQKASSAKIHWSYHSLKGHNPYQLYIVDFQALRL